MWEVPQCHDISSVFVPGREQGVWHKSVHSQHEDTAWNMSTIVFTCPPSLKPHACKSPIVYIVYVHVCMPLYNSQLIIFLSFSLPLMPVFLPPPLPLLLPLHLLLSWWHPVVPTCPPQAFKVLGSKNYMHCKSAVFHHRTWSAAQPKTPAHTQRYVHSP